MDEYTVEHIIAAGGGTHGNALRRWMERHHDDLARKFAADEPNWQSLARGFAKLGITGRNGRTCTADSVRMCWVIVHRRSRLGLVAAPPAEATPRVSAR